MPTFATLLYAKFRGRVKLNGTDINEFYYVLELSEEVK